MTFMSRPTEVLEAYVQMSPGERKAFKWGRISVGLEVLTQVKILRELPFTDQTVAVTTALETLLQDCGLYDEAEVWYDRLDAWRAPRFVADATRGDEMVRGASSAVEAREGAVARTRRLRALPPRHHGPDEVSMRGSAGSHGEEEPSTQTE